MTTPVQINGKVYIYNVADLQAQPEVEVGTTLRVASVECLIEASKLFQKKDHVAVVSNTDPSTPVIMYQGCGMIYGTEVLEKALLVGQESVNVKHINTLPEPTMVFDGVVDYHQYLVANDLI